MITLLFASALAVGQVQTPPQPNPVALPEITIQPPPPPKVTADRQTLVVPAAPASSCCCCEPYPAKFVRRLVNAYCEYLPKCQKKDEKKEECKPPEAGAGATNGPSSGSGNADATSGQSGGGDAKSGNTSNTSNGGNGQANGNAGGNRDSSEPPKPRRALAAPFDSPPFPSGEYQGYPLIGVPPDDTVYPLMKAIYGGPWGEEIKDSRIATYGWFNASGNWSTSRNSNTPDSYWIAANRFELDQIVLRTERQVDSVQQDHVDFGFRSTWLYGIDYRYMTAGGWFSNQLLEHNRLYGADPTEQYIDVYLPGLAQGMIVRVGRWIACPDIETQFAPDNFMGSHSLLFTFDTYTQTGVMLTTMLDKQWTIQACIHSGTDMAPWYPGAIPTGMFGIRWVSCDNNDSVYLVLNDINDAEFRYFEHNGKLEGHDNFNYIVGTWQHRFNSEVQTRTEGYYMWQQNAVLGGTPSFGPLEPWGGGGGFGAPIPGTSRTYGIVNYTCLECTKKSFVTFRNEWWRDEEGERSGFPGTYTSTAVGFTYNFTPVFQVRPEIGWYRNWHEPAFDLGTRRNLVQYGFDMTWRF
jgi:hypothetical protein